MRESLTGVMNHLLRFAPQQFVETDSALYRMETRALPRGRSLTDLQRWTLHLLLRVVGAGTAAWVIFVLVGMLLSIASLADLSRTGILIIAATAVMADVRLVAFALATDEHDHARVRPNGLWDLLRLTPVEEGDLFSTWYAVGLLRTWQATMIVIGTRIAILLIYLLNAVLIPVASSGGNITFAEQYADYAVQSPLYALNVLVSACVMAGIMLIEPMWRTQALTAVRLNSVVQAGDIQTGARQISLVGVLTMQYALYASMVWFIYTIASMTDFDNYQTTALVFIGIFVTSQIYDGIRRYNLKQAFTHTFYR